jgi:poly-gamma-glutamate capsule biosynthesis protein CapA/YwtB (metallophosphatase superfamily)
MTDARGYVYLAEQANGPMRKPVEFSAIWGDAITELDRQAPDVRLINLETAVTKSDDFWKGKGINYRMHPENIPVLSAARIDIVALANNHILDWGYAGLVETIDTLRKMKIGHAGAGRNMAEAAAPAVQDLGRARVLVFSYATESSGVPVAWRADENRPGVNMIADLSENMVRRIGEEVRRVKKAGDIAVLSIHWGPNWGYEITASEERFSHGLINEAGVDLIHGHSSHHVKRIEVYRGKLILYGCGDFLDDYEGIKGLGAYRGDLGLMYFARLDPESGRLLALDMTPTQIRHFRINRASPADSTLLANVLNREGRGHRTRVTTDAENRLRLTWDE